jgi:MFS transporter, DHA1 family, inner membrane transport protein
MPAPDRPARLLILSLALGAFAIGITEFAVMGLLPYYARDLGVTEPVAGYAVSAYALGVVVGAPVLAILGARFHRRAFLVGLMMFFTAANLVCAVAPEIGILVAARFLAGLPHGAFLGVSMLAAAALQPKGQGARGIAQVMYGLTIANIIGVPAASAIGQALGWRICFLIVSLLGAASAAMVLRFAPLGSSETRSSPHKELSALRNRAVWLVLLVGAVGFGGIFAVYSYLSAALISAAQAPAWSIPLALSAFGIGATFGNVIASRLAGWSQMKSAAILLTGMTFVPLVYAAVMGHWPFMALSVLALGLTASVFIPLQMRLIDVAGDAQMLAAALNHAAFNLANAIGPFLAGLALSAGFGWASTGLVGSGLAAGGFVLLIVVWRDSRRRPSSRRYCAAAARH